MWRDLLALVGAIALAGGGFKTGQIELSLRTARGRLSWLYMVMVFVGLAIIIVDLLAWWGRE